MDFLYKIYNATFNSNWKLLAKLIRFSIFTLANVFAYPYYRVKCRVFPSVEYTDIPVNLTSFPSRIGRLHLVIYSLLTQQVRPKTIYLWLSKKQFPNLEKDLPIKLLRLTDFGLILKFVEEDYRSYKKYYHFINEYGNQSFITVDDDILYHSTAIKLLVNEHQDYPTSVCANRVMKITNNSPYSTWNVYFGKPLNSINLIPTGCGAVLYPKNCFSSYVLRDDLFNTLCLDADDIWLNVNSFINNTEVRFTGFNYYLIDVFNFSAKHLHKKNVGGGNNDKAISQVKTYFIDELKIDVFDRDVDNLS